MLRQAIKRVLFGEGIISKIVLRLICYLPFNNRIAMGNNVLTCSGLVYRSRFRIMGTNNIVRIGKGVRLNRVSIRVNGNNNVIDIQRNANLTTTEIVMEDDGGGLVIGEGTSLSGNTHLAVIEGKKIEIGNNCMFSANITVRVGDSHSIIQDESGKRINQSQSVIIGDHVWIGNQVILLKGTQIPPNCIVGSGSVVTKSFDEENVIIAGNPGRIVKRGINWLIERIEMEEENNVSIY